MILFYSDYCKHCNILIENIKRHDQNKICKLVSIDTLRSMKKPIDPKIHSVPALYITHTKEYMFGKAVFDHLLLPNRGVLFTSKITRDNNKGDAPASGISHNNISQSVEEPMAFSLGTIYSENFSSIDEKAQVSDINFKWDMINDGGNIAMPMQEPVINQLSDANEKKNLPSMEDIMNQRNKDLL